MRICQSFDIKTVRADQEDDEKYLKNTVKTSAEVELKREVRLYLIEQRLMPMAKEKGEL
ncbi:MAG: hypothetical protein QXR45_11235 [Candidatus Bathyarchaeia archaeon]